MIEPGQRLNFHYPTNTNVESIYELRHRSVIIEYIRDLVADPLTPAEYLRKPMVRRSRCLIQTRDQETGQWRKFYLGTSQEYHTPGLLRLGLYEPGCAKPWRIISGQYEQTRQDRILLSKLIQRIIVQDLGELELRVIADDLRFHN